MRSLWLFSAGLLTGFLLMGLSYEFHIVRFDQGFLVIPKMQAALKNVYVDIRDWSLEDWGDHPEVARALIQDGRSDLITTGAADDESEPSIPPLPDDPEVAHPFETQRQ